MVYNGYINLGELAAILHVGRDKIHKWMDSGALPFFKNPLGLLFKPADVVTFLRGRTMSTPAVAKMPPPSAIDVNSLTDREIMSLPRAAKACGFQSRHDLYRLWRLGEIPVFDLSEETRTGLRVLKTDVHNFLKDQTDAVPATETIPIDSPLLPGVLADVKVMDLSLNDMLDKCVRRIETLQADLAVEQELRDLIDQVLTAQPKIAKLMSRRNGLTNAALAC